MNIPDNAIINNKPKFIFVKGDGMGMGAQDVSAKIRAMIGDRVNRIGDDMVGFVASFVINFSPSAIGWRRPSGPTRFGPFRCCM